MWFRTYLRFAMAGFERAQINGQIVNNAQSWLCSIEEGQG